MGYENSIEEKELYYHRLASTTIFSHYTQVK